MHIRPKPWARPELETCGFFIPDPTTYCGKWQQTFAHLNPIHLELGCGKGTFIAELGKLNPTINYIAIDLIDAVLGVSKRNIVTAYNGHPIENIKLAAYDITRIENILGFEDAVERIYINFCNPWPKRRYHKKRLTHSRQLENYKKFLSPGGEIRFKTDDDALFEASLRYFKSSGFVITTEIRDLHHSDFIGNIETEHEQMFSEKGIPIKLAIATLKTPSKTL